MRVRRIDAVIKRFNSWIGRVTGFVIVPRDLFRELASASRVRTTVTVGGPISADNTLLNDLGERKRLQGWGT